MVLVGIIHVADTVNTTLLFIMLFSIAFQFLAALLAVRLIPVSGAFIAWIVLACGFVIQALRRIVSLHHVLVAGAPGDMPVEILGLIISMLMVLGIWKFGPLFSEIKQSRQAMAEKQAELLEVNRKLAAEVAERERVEKSLTENEQLYRAVADYSYDWEYWIDVDGSFRYISPYCKVVSGYEQEEFYADPQLLQRIVHPEDRNGYATHVTLACASDGSAEPIEFRIVTRDGQVRWIEHVCGPVHDPSGKPHGRRSSNRDITARKQAETLLRESEARYRHLYNDTPVMLHSIDHDGRLISVSNFWLATLGYERSEVLGRRTSEFLTVESRRYAEEVVLPEFFRTGLCTEIPYRFVKKNGEILDVLLSAIAERDAAGTVVRSLAVMIDITERNKAQQEIEKLNTDLAARAAELESTNRELEAFSYSVSHDLRTPLTVIGGFTQLIQKMCGPTLDAQCQEYLEIIYSNALSMEKLIDALLNLSLVARTELHREEFDLGKIAQVVAAELALTDPERRVIFRISTEVTANGDAHLLRMVLENLLGNAWKYTSKQEEVVIEFGVMATGEGQTFYVRDNGPGFESAHADKLFLPFHRLHRIEAEGHGIGLATVARIVTRHGGKVWAEGEPDKGAAFYFTL